MVMPDKLPIWQLWLGRPSVASRACEQTVENVYSGYAYHRLTGKQLPTRIRNLIGKVGHAAVSDVFRAWALWKHGGVWLDSDIIAQREIPFRTMLAERPNAIITANHSPADAEWASSGIMAAGTGHPVMKQAYEESIAMLEQHGRTLDYLAAGPALVTRLLRKHKDQWIILDNHQYAHKYSNSVLQRRYRWPFARERDTDSRDWYYAHVLGACLKKHRELTMPALMRYGTVFSHLLRTTYEAIFFPPLYTGLHASYLIRSPSTGFE